MNQTLWETLERTLESLSATEKLEFIERVARSLRAATPSVSGLEQREALQKLCRELGALPVHNPTDGFTHRDHDRILYR